MLPLLPFVAGIATGALAIKLWRNQNTRAGVEKAEEKLLHAAGTAQEKLRKATVSSLEAIEHSSAKMRARLTAPQAAVKTAAKKPAATRKPAKTTKSAKTAKVAKPSAEAAS